MSEPTGEFVINEHKPADTDTATVSQSQPEAGPQPDTVTVTIDGQQKEVSIKQMADLMEQPGIVAGLTREMIGRQQEQISKRAQEQGPSHPTNIDAAPAFQEHPPSAPSHSEAAQIDQALRTIAEEASADKLEVNPEDPPEVITIPKLDPEPVRKPKFSFWPIKIYPSDNVVDVTRAIGNTFMNLTVRFPTRLARNVLNYFKQGPIKQEAS